MSMLHAVDHATHHPVIAGFISLASFICGLFVKFIPQSIYSWHVPPVIMELLQSMAWVVAIVAGSISILGWVRNTFFNKGKKQVP